MRKYKIMKCFTGIEINLRKQLKYPPFCDIILFGVSAEDEKIAENVSNKIYSMFLKKINKFEDINIYKPRPAPIDKIKNKYRWRIIIKGKFDNNMIEEINSVLQEVYTYNKKARIVVDVNPTNMM